MLVRNQQSFPGLATGNSQAGWGDSALHRNFFEGRWLRSIVPALEQLAASDVPVVFQGETGTGKEVLARELHLRSRRSGRPFLKLNCAAVPLELLESELFGYEKGAFTGALNSKPGKFDQADGGTILLDEVGDMDIKLQAKLLHVLQDKQFQRLGGTETIQVDVRILAATHRDLRVEIEAGRFREDLYYRLNVVTIHVPPLRDRRDEILPLARFFLARYAEPGQPVPSLSSELEEVLLSYQWPGNIRELENLMRRFLIFPDPERLAAELRNGCGNGYNRNNSNHFGAISPGLSGELPTLTQLEQERNRAEACAIQRALEAARWNRRKAAALLNIEYKAFLYRMKKLGIDKFPPAAAGRQE